MSNALAQTVAGQPRPVELPEPQLAGRLTEICRQAGEEAQGLMLSGGALGAQPPPGRGTRRRPGAPAHRLHVGSGCTCGALSGAQVALWGYSWASGAMAASARALHDGFNKAAHGSTCCRVLKRKVKGGRARKEHCASLNGHAAELACRLVLAAGCPRQGRRADQALARPGLGAPR